MVEPMIIYMLNACVYIYRRITHT